VKVLFKEKKEKTHTRNNRKRNYTLKLKEIREKGSYAVVASLEIE